MILRNVGPNCFGFFTARWTVTRCRPMWRARPAGPRNPAAQHRRSKFSGLIFCALRIRLGHSYSALRTVSTNYLCQRTFSVRETNRDFAELVKASGWSQTKVARRLFVEPGTISRYCSDAMACPAGAVEHFKLVLADEMPEALEAGARSPEVRDVQAKVREIHDRDENAFRAVRVMVDGLHRSLPALGVQLSPKDRAKLTPEQQARVREAARAGAVAAARLAQKPKAASTTGNKFAPRLLARQDSDDQQSPPAQAPAKRASG